MKKTSLYITAAQNLETERPPVWMMRQAGRYLPEYRALRSTHTFKEMMSTPDLATEITLQPIRRFGMDAAILFSDILVIPESLGASFDFFEGQGPIFENPITTKADIAQLSTDHSSENLHYVYTAITQIKSQLAPFNIPLIGFAGAPFTVASYMIEGKSSATLKKCKQLIAQDPDTLHALLEKITATTITYLNAQIKHGVEALQLFDTWAGLLSWDDFKTVSLPYITRIIHSLHNPDRIPVTVFCKNTAAYFDLIKDTGCDVVSLDWTVNLVDTLKNPHRKVAIQGNLDPYWLHAPLPLLKSKITTILTETAPHKGYIFNLGHGLMPDIPPDAVKCVVDTIKEYGPQDKGLV
jgi:uroporphyrinogen decarboxylase